MISDKVFVGRRCASVSKPPALDPISKIILWIDSENCYEAGDDTGREFEITCPYGTQQMADDLLQKLSGYVYQPMQARDALIDPAAELGDAVTVDGCYTELSSMELSFDSLMAADISAPGSSELPQEYSFSGTEKILNRKIARNRSLISKTAEQIRLEVFGEDGYTGSSITAQIDEIAGEVNGKINGEEASALIKAALDGIELRIENNTAGTAASIKLSYKDGDTNVAIAAGTINLTGLVTITGLASGMTEIDGGCIKNDSLYTNALHLGGSLTVYKTRYGEDPGGYLGYDSGFYGSTPGIGIRSENQYSQIVCTDLAARMSYSDDDQHITQVVCGQELALSSVGSIQFSIGGNVQNVVAGLDSYAFYPADMMLTLGTAQNRWVDVFAAGTSMSALLERIEKLEAA